MPESIKQTYENIYNLIYNSVTPLIGNFFDINRIKYIESNIINIIKNYYPYYEFDFSLNWNEYNHSLNPNFNLSSKYFKFMVSSNYKTHNFIESAVDAFYSEDVLKCQKCNILITLSGKPIDGDYSCDEWIIKNIIE